MNVFSKSYTIIIVILFLFSGLLSQPASAGIKKLCKRAWTQLRKPSYTWKFPARESKGEILVYTSDVAESHLDVQNDARYVDGVDKVLPPNLLEAMKPIIEALGEPSKFHLTLIHFSKRDYIQMSFTIPVLVEKEKPSGSEASSNLYRDAVLIARLTKNNQVIISRRDSLDKPWNTVLYNEIESDPERYADIIESRINNPFSRYELDFRINMDQFAALVNQLIADQPFFVDYSRSPLSR